MSQPQMESFAPSLVSFHFHFFHMSLSPGGRGGDGVRRLQQGQGRGTGPRRRLVMNSSVHLPPTILFISHCCVLLRAQAQEQNDPVPILALPLLGEGP